MTASRCNGKESRPLTEAALVYEIKNAGLFLFYTDRLNLLLSLALGFKGRGTNLDPRRLSRTGLHDLTFFRRLLLHDVIFRTSRRHDQGDCSASYSNFFWHFISSC